VEAPTEQVPSKNAAGQEKGSLGYSAEEHVARSTAVLYQRHS